METGGDLRHPLARALHCTEDDILTAIAHGRRSIVDAKGKLAELHLERYLTGLQEPAFLEVLWLDEHNKPDFVVRIGRDAFHYSEYKVECKNVRSPNAGVPGPVRVELQKTRHSKTGKTKRNYQHDHFHILAVCMFNRTGRWAFLFRASNTLPKASGESGYLQTMIPVDSNVLWRENIIDAINDFEQARDTGVSSDRRVVRVTGGSEEATSGNEYQGVRADDQQGAGPGGRPGNQPAALEYLG